MVIVVTKTVACKTVEGTTLTTSKEKHYKYKKAKIHLSDDEMCHKCAIKSGSKLCDQMFIDRCDEGYFVKIKHTKHP